MAPSSSASNSAFKPIRDAVDRAEALHSDEDDNAGARAKQPRLSQDGGDAEGAGAMDEDRNRGWEGEGGEAGYHPVDQIESLCMECHEQVGNMQADPALSWGNRADLYRCAGHNASPPHHDSLLQRGHHHVVPLPALR